MTDIDTTLADLEGEIAKFCNDRDWDSFHTPKDLAIGISSEAGELLELFRFKDEAQCRTLIADPVRGKNVRDELSDVLYFVLRFAQMNGIDMSDALRSKMADNSVKYPVDKCKGRNEKYDEYD